MTKYFCIFFTKIVIFVHHAWLYGRIVVINGVAEKSFERFYTYYDEHLYLLESRTIHRRLYIGRKCSLDGNRRDKAYLLISCFEHSEWRFHTE